MSNIRQQGLPPAEAAYRLAWLIAAARRLGASGVALKDESRGPLIADSRDTPPEAPPAIPVT